MQIKTEIDGVLSIEELPDTAEFITAQIEQLLDAKAQAMRYDSIVSARSYAGYVNPFQVEALRLANWSAACWAQAGAIEAQILAGTLPMQTAAQVLAALPAFV